MVATKMARVKLIDRKYINNKFKGVHCRLLRPPDVGIDCQMELDVNSDGAAELQEAARDRVKKYIDSNVGIVVRELPKMEHRVEDIALKYCQAWPPGKPQRELEKKLGDVLEKEIKAHNTMIGQAMKGIESGVPRVVEEARKEVAKRKSAIKKMKIKTGVKIGVAAGMTLLGTAATIIGIVGGVVATVMTGGIALIVTAAVAAAIGGLVALTSAGIAIATAVRKAGGSADNALKDLKKSMKAVNEHRVYQALSKLPDAAKKEKWRALQSKLSPAFAALEVKAKNYETFIYNAIAAGSKANNQFEKLQNEADKLDATIHKELAKNKDAAKDSKVKDLITQRDFFENAAMKVLDLHSANMKLLDDYHHKAKVIRDIVGQYKKDTPPVLQKANAILATIREVGPSLEQVVKLLQTVEKASTGMNKIAKAV